MTEKILCASIWYKNVLSHKNQKKRLPKNIKQGIVIHGYRHENIRELVRFFVMDGWDKDFGIIEQEDGFLTNLNRFVSREEGAKIAYNAGQILPNPYGLTIIPDRLFSEDLY